MIVVHKWLHTYYHSLTWIEATVGSILTIGKGPKNTKARAMQALPSIDTMMGYGILSHIYKIVEYQPQIILILIDFIT